MEKASKENIVMDLKTDTEDLILQGTCSTSVVRISTDNLSESEAQQILDLLERMAKTEEEPIEGSDNGWYDTSFNRDSIFGKNFIEINGEVPYNLSDWLDSELRTLSF